MGVGGERHAPAALPPGKKAGIHDIGGWVGPRASLDGHEKSPPIWIPYPERIAIPTTPSRSHTHTHTHTHIHTHTDIHTHIYIYIYTHTHIPAKQRETG